MENLNPTDVLFYIRQFLSYQWDIDSSLKDLEKDPNHPYRESFETIIANSKSEQEYYSSSIFEAVGVKVSLTKNNLENLSHILEEIKEEEKVLSDMVRSWDEDDDPCSDPGLQFEQGQILQEKLDNLKDFLAKAQ